MPPSKADLVTDDRRSRFMTDRTTSSLPVVHGRGCPRVAVWANDAEQQERLRRRFATGASRVSMSASSWSALRCVSAPAGGG